jgi:small conductance mechanosensitive channel
MSPVRVSWLNAEPSCYFRTMGRLSGSTCSLVVTTTENLAIVVGGIVMILDAAGVPIAPLLGGAGVVRLAIAFAAQRALVVLDVGVAYKEQIDQVIGVLMGIAGGMTTDADFSEFVLGEPEMFGVDALADMSVVVKLGLKVLPDKQWAIKRKLLRRIKGRVDELGIEIPFPQQTVHHRMENREAVPMHSQPPVGEHHS